MADLVIWKFPIPMADEFSISMPIGGQILSIQAQQGRGQMWVLVDPKAPPEQRHFRIARTGYGYSTESFTSRRYLGTLQMKGGAPEWHVFEEVTYGPKGPAA